MCGRFELHSALAVIAQVFGLAGSGTALMPRYNIAPGQDIPIVVNEGAGRVLVMSRWGLLPHWAKDVRHGHKMINARVETVAEKPAFRSAFREHRCLVIADGFYEWKREGAKKTPFYVHQRSGEPFAFAGLYSDWTAPEGGTVRTNAIVTTGAYAPVAAIHDRMPVIMQPEDYDLWLDPGVHDRDRLQRLLAPPERDDLELYEVTAKVNSPKNDSPENIEKKEEV